MNTISILGCGWLGLPLAKFLSAKGFRVKGSTTTTQKLQPLRDAGILAYLLSLNPELTDPSDFFSCDVLIINIPPRNKEGLPNFHQTQLENVRDVVRKHLIPKILFVSSTGVYPNLNRVVTEFDADGDSLSRGGVSLVQTETIFQQPDFKTTVLRFGGLYGPNRHPGRFLAGKKDLPGADNPINMIHLDDCLNIMHQIIQLDIWNETFNGCSPNSPTRKVFYQHAAQELGLKPPEFSKAPSPYKKVSSEKLIRALDYEFIH